MAADGKLEDSSSTLFQTYLDNTFPPEAKRTRSAVIRQQLADKIVRYLKDPGEDKNFRHFVKSGFELLDLPSLGVRNALVVKVKQDKKVSSYVASCCTIRRESACSWLLCICACAKREIELSHILPCTILGQKENDRTMMGGYRRVAVVEEFADILRQIHNKDSLHAGMKKTFARVHTTQRTHKLLVCCVKFAFLPQFSSLLLYGGSDCGLFALAFATTLCFGENPETISYTQSAMREHLLSCIEKGQLLKFPQRARRRPKPALIDHFPIFCVCRLGYNGEEMVEGSTCQNWYHVAFVHVPLNLLQNEELPWSCAACDAS